MRQLYGNAWRQYLPGLFVPAEEGVGLQIDEQGRAYRKGCPIWYSMELKPLKRSIQMSDFGFGATKGQKANIPKGVVQVTPDKEEQALAAGEKLGFTDRGQAKRRFRKRPPPAPTMTLFIRAPEELAEWFHQYTEEQGHRALWNSLEDFKHMVEEAD